MNDIVQATTRIVAQQTIEPVLSDDSTLQEQLYRRKKFIVFILQTIIVLLM